MKERIILWPSAESPGVWAFWPLCFFCVFGALGDLILVWFTFSKFGYFGGFGLTFWVNPLSIFWWGRPPATKKIFKQSHNDLFSHPMKTNSFSCTLQHTNARLCENIFSHGQPVRRLTWELMSANSRGGRMRLHTCKKRACYSGPCCHGGSGGGGRFFNMPRVTCITSFSLQFWTPTRKFHDILSPKIGCGIFFGFVAFFSRNPPPGVLKKLHNGT